MSISVNFFKTIFAKKPQQFEKIIPGVAEQVGVKSKTIFTEFAEPNTSYVNLRIMPFDTLKKIKQYSLDIQTLKDGQISEGVIAQYRTTRCPVKYINKEQLSSEQRTFISKLEDKNKEDSLNKSLDEALALAKKRIEVQSKLQKENAKIEAEKAKEALIDKFNSTIDLNIQRSYGLDKNVEILFNQVPKEKQADVLFDVIKRHKMVLNDGMRENLNIVKNKLVDIINSTNNEEMRVAYSKILKKEIESIGDPDLSANIVRLINLTKDKTMLADKFKNVLSVSSNDFYKTAHLESIGTYLKTNPTDKTFNAAIDAAINNNLNDSMTTGAAYEALAQMEGSYSKLKNLLISRPKDHNLLTSLLSSAKTEVEKKDCANFILDLCKNIKFNGIYSEEVFKTYELHQYSLKNNWAKSHIIRPMIEMDFAKADKNYREELIKILRTYC